jgi:hypothetical protein
VLRKILRPRRNEVTGEWRRVNYEELYNLCSPSNIRVTKSRRMKWAGHVARIEEKCLQDFGGKSLGKKTIGRPGRRWEHTIKIDLQEVGWGDRLD